MLAIGLQLLGWGSVWVPCRGGWDGDQSQRAVCQPVLLAPLSPHLPCTADHYPKGTRGLGPGCQERHVRPACPLACPPAHLPAWHEVTYGCPQRELPPPMCRAPVFHVVPACPPPPRYRRYFISSYLWIGASFEFFSLIALFYAAYRLAGRAGRRL